MHLFRLLLAFLLVTVAVTAASSQTAPLPLLPVMQLDAGQSDPDMDGPRISVGFSEPTPIRDVLMLLVRGTRMSLIPHPSLEQTFIGDLKNVSLREALDLILEPLGLDYSVRGQVIRVFPRELETRLYGIDYVLTDRAGSRSMVGTSGSGRDSPNMYGDLAEGIRALLSVEGRMNLDRTAGLLQVTDRASRLARVEQYLEAVMLRVTRQVQIDAKVIEVELRDESSTGINWRAVLGSLPNTATSSQIPAPAPAGGFTLALNGDDFTALLNAFAAQGKVNVLSSLRFTAMNNEPAVMRTGTEDVFFVPTTRADSQPGQSTVTPQTLTEGLLLSVTPQISADGIIHMSINPTVTARTGVATSRLGDTVPIISVRETDTLVRVRQGETAVITGMMLDRASVDSAKALLRRKTDLVILLTPSVMGPGETLAAKMR